MPEDFIPTEGQPEPSAEGQEQGSGNQPASSQQSFSLDDVKKIIQTVVSDELTNFSRSQQSARDKQEARLQKEIGNLKALGIEPNADQTTAIRKRVLVELEQEGQQGAGQPPAQPSQSTPGQGQPADAANQPQANPIYSAADEIFTEANVDKSTLTTEETEALRNFQGTPRQFLKKVEEIAQAHARTPGATLPTITGGSTPVKDNPYKGKSSMDILSMGFQQASKR